MSVTGSESSPKTQVTYADIGCTKKCCGISCATIIVTALGCLLLFYSPFQFPQSLQIARLVTGYTLLTVGVVATIAELYFSCAPCCRKTWEEEGVKIEQEKLEKQKSELENKAYQELREAIIVDDCEKANELLSKGGEFNLNAYDAQGWTLLHHAVVNASPAIVELLVERGANVNAQAQNRHKERRNREGWEGYTPLHFALYSGPLQSENANCDGRRLEIVNILLEHDANQTKRDYLNHSPIYYATLYNYNEIAARLKR